MSDIYSINDLNHAQIEAWLAQALKGQKPLPRLTPDEPHHLAIVRLEQSQEAPTRRSIEAACNNLLRQFCAEGQGDADYLKELLALAAQLKTSESMPMLVSLSKRFKELPELSFDVRYSVLAVLTMGAPPQPYEFWFALLKEDLRYAARAISGALAWDKIKAVDMLVHMPDTARAGAATRLKLDMAWDNMLPDMRDQFVCAVHAVLPGCGAEFSKPIAEWVFAKNPQLFQSENTTPKIVIKLNQQSILLGIRSKLGDANAVAIFHTTKIGATLAIAA